jgi:hypothetical protein
MFIEGADRLAVAATESLAHLEHLPDQRPGCLPGAHVPCMQSYRCPPILGWPPVHPLDHLWGQLCDALGYQAHCILDYTCDDAWCTLQPLVFLSLPLSGDQNLMYKGNHRDVVMGRYGAALHKHMPKTGGCVLPLTLRDCAAGTGARSGILP